MDNPEQEVDRNCIFCQKSISDKNFCSSPNFYAIYNVAPILPGHSLIIPKKHFVSILELSDLELGEMMVLARKVTQLLLSVYECTDFDLTVQDGISAGQTVLHLHMHVIPRKPNDLPKGIEWYHIMPESEKMLIDNPNRGKLSVQEYDKITERLRQAYINRID